MFLYIYTKLKDYRESATGGVPSLEVCMTDTLVLLMVGGVTSSVILSFKNTRQFIKMLVKADIKGLPDMIQISQLLFTK
jgi:hypothetical protein